MPTEDPPTQDGVNLSGEEEREGRQRRSQAPSKEAASSNQERPKLSMERVDGPSRESKKNPIPVEKTSGLTRGEKRDDILGGKQDVLGEFGKVRRKAPDEELAAEGRAQEEALRQERNELRKLMEMENSLATLAVAIGPNQYRVNALLDTRADNTSLDAETALQCGFQPLESGSYSVKVGGGRVNT